MLKILANFLLPVIMVLFIGGRRSNNISYQQA